MIGRSLTSAEGGKLFDLFRGRVGGDGGRLGEVLATEMKFVLGGGIDSSDSLFRRKSKEITR